MGVLLVIGAVDILGRVLTLLYLMHHSGVRCLNYRTWVLLTGFINFAFVFYWLLACPFGRKGAAQPKPKRQYEENGESEASDKTNQNNEQEK